MSKIISRFDYAFSVNKYILPFDVIKNIYFMHLRKHLEIDGLKLQNQYSQFQVLVAEKISLRFLTNFDNTNQFEYIDMIKTTHDFHFSFEVFTYFTASTFFKHLYSNFGFLCFYLITVIVFLPTDFT